MGIRLGMMVVVLLCEIASASRSESVSVEGPIIYGPVVPKSNDQSSQDLKKAPKWSPGDPVEVRPDLKESSPPIVDEPVVPKTQERSLKDVPPLEPRENRSIRLMPDLRDSSEAN